MEIKNVLQVDIRHIPAYLSMNTMFLYFNQCLVYIHVQLSNKCAAEHEQRSHFFQTLFKCRRHELQTLMLMQHHILHCPA